MYKLYYIDLVSFELDKYIFNSINEGLDKFISMSYDVSNVFDVDFYMDTIEKNQGWVANYINEECYIVLYKDEPGVIDDFLKWCLDTTTKKLIRRDINLDILI